MAISPVQIYQNPVQNSLDGLFANMSNALTQSMGAVINTGREMLATQKAQESEFLEERKFQKDFNQRRAEAFRGMWEFDVGVQEKRRAEDRGFALDNQQMDLNRIKTFNDYRMGNRQLDLQEQGLPDPSVRRMEAEAGMVNANSNALRAATNFREAQDSYNASGGVDGLPKPMDPIKEFDNNFNPLMAGATIYEMGKKSGAFIDGGGLTYQTEVEELDKVEKGEMDLKAYISKDSNPVNQQFRRSFYMAHKDPKNLTNEEKNFLLQQGVVKIGVNAPNPMLTPPPPQGALDADKNEIIEGVNTP